MARKDSEKDSERPHYYSQFWLDVAAGRRVIGGPKPEENETVEPEGDDDASSPDYTVEAAAPTNRSSAVRHPVVEEPEEDLKADVEPDTAASSDEDETASDSASADEDENFEVPDVDLGETNEDDNFAEDENYDEEDDSDGDGDYEYEDSGEEEEEDDMNWGRGRKKRPARPTKSPAKKPGKRDTRRGF